MHAHAADRLIVDARDVVLVLDENVPADRLRLVEVVEAGRRLRGDGGQRTRIARRREADHGQRRGGGDGDCTEAECDPKTVPAHEGSSLRSGNGGRGRGPA